MNKRQILLEHYLIEVLIQDHFQSKGILLESQLDEGKLKDFIKSVKDNFKSSLRPKFNNLLKGLELTGKPASAISFLSTLKNLDIDLTNKKEVAAAVAYLKNKTKLKEAEGDVVEKDGKKFIETIDPFSGQTLLVPEKDYEGVGNKLEKGGPSIIGKLSNFFNNKRLGKVLKGVLIAAPIFAGLADEIGDTAEQAGQAAGLGDLDITGNDAPSQETIRGLMNAGFSTAEISDYLDSQFAVDTGGQEGGVVDDIKAALDPVDMGDLVTDSNDVSDAKSQGLDINPSGDETVNFTTFDHASSELDQGDKNKIGSENGTIIKFLQNGQDYGETVLGASSNTGPNANVDKAGGDLNSNRLNNTADFILDDLESQLKDQNIDYTRTGDTIQLADGGSYTLERVGVNDPGELDKISRTNDTATQSAIRVGTAGDPPEPTRLFGFDPVRPEKTPPAQPGDPKPDDKEEEKIVPLPGDVEVIYPGNRLHQYAMISQLMNGIDFFKSIGATQDPSGKPLTDAIISGDNTGISTYRSSYENNGPENNLTKQIYTKTLKNLVKNGWGEDDAKNLLARIATLKEGEKIQGIATWIISSRKSPDRIIDYLNEKFPGLKIGQRDKAFFAFGKVTETYLKFRIKQRLLREYIVIGGTKDLPDLDESLVKQNLAQIVGLVTSMYFDAKKGDPLSYDDAWLKENAPDYNKMKKFVRLVGGNYGVFDLEGYNPEGIQQGKVLAGQPQALSGPGGGKSTAVAPPSFDTNPDKKVEPDVEKATDFVDDNSNVKKRLSLINTKEELIQVIVLISTEFVKTNDKVATAALRTAAPRVKLRPGRHLAAFRSNRRSLREFLETINEKQLSFDFDGDGDVAPLPQDTEKDVVSLGQALKTVGIFKGLASRINTKEELIELILNVIFPNVNPSLQKQPTVMRDALLKATEILKKGNVNEINEMSKKKIRQRDKLAKSIKPRTIKQYGKKEGESAAYAIATNMVKEDCGCGCNDCNHTPTEHTINELICDLVYEELCKRGKAYIAARKRAGEKSSAYLSGRAVKVCKGQIKGVGGKRKKSYKRKNESLYNQLKPQVLKHLEETLFNDPHFVIVSEYNVKEANIDESLRNWFKKEDWVRIDTQGNIAGKCGTMPKGKATQRCLPRAKANSLTKAQRRATARKKVRGSKKGKQFVRNTKKAKVSFKKK